jgi:hypothetical protein
LALDIANRETDARNLAAEQILRTGEQLVAALAVQERLSRLSSQRPDDADVFNRWLQSRREVEQCAEVYFLSRSAAKDTSKYGDQG